MDQQVKFVSKRIYVELTNFYFVHIFLRNVSKQGRNIFTGVSNFSWLRFLTFLMYLTRVFIHYFLNMCLICNFIVTTEFQIFTINIFNIIFVTSIIISKNIARSFNILETTIIVFFIRIICCFGIDITFFFIKTMSIF